jgi:hypothetical protein
MAATSVCLLLLFLQTQAKRPDTIYMNQFAVHIPSGEAAANKVADTHGFDNRGQVRLMFLPSK